MFLQVSYFSFSNHILNTTHALWFCQHIHTVWESVFGWIRKDYLALSSFSELVLLVRRQAKQMDLFAIVAWSIWCQRNKIRCNEQNLPLGKIMESSASLLTEFQKHYNSGVRVPQQRDVKWKPPTASMMWKTNFDGAMFSEFGLAGIGVVITYQKPGGVGHGSIIGTNNQTHFSLSSAVGSPVYPWVGLSAICVWRRFGGHH